jgi:branched-chain amino acid transport system substrate-binding protein
LNKKFVEAFTAKYGNPPDQFAAQAYAGVFIAHKAIAMAGSPTNHKAIRNAMTRIKDLDTVLGKFSFTPERDAGCTPVVQIVKDGKFAVLGD